MVIITLDTIALHDAKCFALFAPGQSSKLVYKHRYNAKLHKCRFGHSTKCIIMHGLA